MLRPACNGLLPAAGPTRPAARALRRAVCLGLTVGAALLTLSCGSSSKTATGPSPVKCSVEVRAESTGFPPAGGSGALVVSTNRECTWSARSDVAWLTLGSPATGQGDGSITFTVAANSDPSARSARITVENRQLEISQQGTPCGLRLSSSGESIGPEGGTRAIQVHASSAQCNWTATAHDPWITITSGTSGTGDGKVEFRVDATDGPSRKGTLTVGGRDVAVVQSPGCSVAVDPPTFSAPATGSAGVVKVGTSDGCGWTAQSDADWITLTTGSSGIGPGELRFSVAASDGPPRTGTIHVADRAVTVTQGSGCAVSVNPSRLNAGARGGGDTIEVHDAAGCGWTATSQASWIDVIAGGSGTGDGRVQLSIASNSGPERTGSVTIGGQTVAVTQANGCSYDVAPRSVDIPGTGGTAMLSITTGAQCTWKAASNDGWISVPVRSGTGPEQLQIRADANTSPPRSGTITVAGQSIAVTQASPCTFVLSPPFADYNAEGGGGAILVIVTGGCSWTAKSGAEWITITSGASGTGDGLVQFMVAATSGPARTGVLTIAGQQFSVRQAGR